MRVGIIIPARNEAAALRQVLAELPRSLVHEVIVVDNGSTDNTRDVLEALRHGSDGKLRCLSEPRVGKPCAVNTALREARGGLIVLTDDDIASDPDWLMAIWRAFQETNAEALAGRILPLWVDGRPEGLTDQVLVRLGALGLVDFGAERFMVDQYPKQFWWVGGNIALRRGVLDRLGGYDERLMCGEDTELFSRCRASGVKILYEPSAVVRHRVGAERLTPAYLKGWHRRSGYYRALTAPWQKYHLVTLLSFSWYRDTLRLAKLWGKAGGDSAERRWERLAYACRLRACWSQWRHRLQLWPRWCRLVVTGRATLRGPQS